MSTYSELLKDPRWIARRFEVIERANWCCEECGENLIFSEESINVHHRHYRAGAKPWEYENADLMCLCRKCHELYTDELERVYLVVGKLPVNALSRIVAYANTLLVADIPRRKPEQILNYECEEV